MNPIQNKKKGIYKLVFHKADGTKIAVEKECTSFCSALIISGGLSATDFEGVEFIKVEVYEKI